MVKRKLVSRPSGASLPEHAILPPVVSAPSGGNGMLSRLGKNRKAQMIAASLTVAGAGVADLVHYYGLPVVHVAGWQGDHRAMLVNAIANQLPHLGSEQVEKLAAQIAAAAGPNVVTHLGHDREEITPAEQTQIIERQLERVRPEFQKLFEKSPLSLIPQDVRVAAFDTWIRPLGGKSAEEIGDGIRAAEMMLGQIEREYGGAGNLPVRDSVDGPARFIGEVAGAMLRGETAPEQVTKRLTGLAERVARREVPEECRDLERVPAARLKSCLDSRNNARAIGDSVVRGVRQVGSGDAARLAEEVKRLREEAARSTGAAEASKGRTADLQRQLEEAKKAAAAARASLVAADAAAAAAAAKELGGVGAQVVAANAAENQTGATSDAAKRKAEEERRLAQEAARNAAQILKAAEDEERGLQEQLAKARHEEGLYASAASKPTPPKSISMPGPSPEVDKKSKIAVPFTNYPKLYADLKLEDTGISLENDSLTHVLNNPPTHLKGTAERFLAEPPRLDPKNKYDKVLLNFFAQKK